MRAQKREKQMHVAKLLHLKVLEEKMFNKKRNIMLKESFCIHSHFCLVTVNIMSTAGKKKLSLYSAKLIKLSI